jgi:hypothetical protein
MSEIVDVITDEMLGWISRGTVMYSTETDMKIAAELLQSRQRIAMLESQLEAANEDAAFLSRALHTLYNDTGESYTIVEKAQEQHKSRIQEAQNG